VRLQFLSSGVVCLTACGLFPSLEDYQSNGTDASTDVVTVDAPIDVNKADSGSFCGASTHAFCSDFELPNVNDGWSSKQTTSSGTVSLSTDLSTSPSHSMLAVMPRRAANAPAAYALLRQDFAVWHRIVVEFDFFARAPAWQTNDVNSGVFVLFYYSSATPGEGLSLSMGQGYTTLSAPNNMQLSGATLPTEAWQHARIDMDPIGKVDATFGTVHFTGAFPPIPTGTSPKMSLQLGISGYNQPAPEFRIYYDNVTVDFL
jgi:hypothetical protein